MDNVIDWLNENELRAYPLIEGSHGLNLPENFLIDLILKVNTTYTGAAKLLSVVKNGNTLSVLFTGAGNVFNIDLNNFSAPLYLRNNNGSLAVFGAGVHTVASGLIEDDEHILNLPLEPATVFQFDGPWLGVSNLRPLEGFKTVSEQLTAILPLEKETAEEALTLSGDIDFAAGFNYAINFNGNLINMDAAFGLGEPMSCATEFIAPELKDCADIVSFINGVPPEDKGIFRFIADSNIALFDGVSVSDQIDDNTAAPPIYNVNENTLFVGLTFLETDLCSPIQLLPTNN